PDCPLPSIFTQYSCFEAIAFISHNSPHYHSSIPLIYNYSGSFLLDYSLPTAVRTRILLETSFAAAGCKACLQQNMPVSSQSYSREGCIYVFDIIISIHEFC